MVYTLLIKNTLFVEKWMRIWLFALFFFCLCPKSLCEPQWRFCGIFHEVIMNIFELALGFNYKCSRWCVSKKHYKFTFLRSKSNFFHLKVESQHEIITDFISLILNAFLFINLFHESSKHIIFNIKIVFDFWSSPSYRTVSVIFWKNNLLVFFIVIIKKQYYCSEK